MYIKNKPKSWSKCNSEYWLSEVEGDSNEIGEIMRLVVCSYYQVPILNDWFTDTN